MEWPGQVQVDLPDKPEGISLFVVRASNNEPVFRRKFTVMSIPTPHFLLFSEAGSEHPRGRASVSAAAARWRFVLESVDGESRFEAADEEESADGDRLALLAVVRGLEALDQRSRVTLVTSSRYVNRGFRFGIDQWRESGWQWERFGEMSPIKNHDLWRRVDGAMKFHDVECRLWQFEALHEEKINEHEAIAEATSLSSDASQRRPVNTSQSLKPQPMGLRAACNGLRRKCSGILRSLAWNGWETQTA